jgi:uncharacterized glyoxalase superfamily protein PhnB
MALSKGVSVRMPNTENPFCDAFCMLVDQYVIPWMIKYAPAA